MRRIVIVGGLAAGPAAASRAKKVDPNAEVVLLEQGEHIAYGVCELPYLVSGEITNNAILRPYDAERFGRSYGVDVRIFHRVERIEVTNREVVVRNMFRGPVSSLPYDRLILATGSRVRPLGITGERAENVFRLKTFDDALALCAWLEGRRTKRSVVVGGGYIGLEAAESLRLRGCDVTVVEAADRLLHDMDPSLSTAAQETLVRNGVRVQTGSKVLELSVDNGSRVRRVVTNAGTVDTDVVIVAAGVEPETTLATDVGIRVGETGAMRCDARQETSQSGIFAAGDCCEIRDAATGRWSYMPLATIAYRQGRTAGENVAGGSAECKDAVRAIGLRLFDADLVQVGITELDAKNAGIATVTEHISSTDRVSFLKNSRPVTMRLIADAKTRRILGGSIVGGPGSAQMGTMISMAVHERLSTDAFARLDHVYAPPMAPFKDPLTIAARRMHSERFDR